MALQSTYTSNKLGFTTDEAYTKITGFYYDTGKVILNTSTYYNKLARDLNKNSIGENTFIFNIDTSLAYSFIDFYKFIKEQAFPTAIDV